MLLRQWHHSVTANTSSELCHDPGVWKQINIEFKYEVISKDLVQSFDIVLTFVMLTSKIMI